MGEGDGRTFNIHHFNLYIERAEERLKRKMKDGGGGGVCSMLAVRAARETSDDGPAM